MYGTLFDISGCYHGVGRYPLRLYPTLGHELSFGGDIWDNGRNNMTADCMGINQYLFIRTQL